MPRALFQAMRPTHWVKNVFVFAPLVFAQLFADPQAVALSTLTFVVFCMLSSGVYLINDIADREVDRQHPRKRERPIAAGRLPVGVAGVAAAILVALGLVVAFALDTGLGILGSIYFLMNLAYSFALKRVVVVDVMLIAAGFLLRAWAGAVALGVLMSHWLVLCTGLIALFLGFVKRRQEIATLGQAADQRPILREYSLPFLDQMISIVTASTVLAYSLYAFSPELAERMGGRSMGITIPFVLFGIFRYLYLVYQRGEGDNPTALVLKDRALLVTIALWVVSTVLVLYWPAVS